MHKKMGKRTVAIGAALIVLLLAACSAPASPTTEATVDPNQPAGTPAAGMNGESIAVTGSELDEMFINMMVPHHQGAVEMARIALERAEHPEIQSMAQDIISGQAAEIDQMKAWKLAWYGSDETPPMSAMPMMEAMPGMGEAGHPMDMQAEVEALRSAAEPFDLAFIDAMIPHHQSAIEAAEMVLENASHPEIRELAQQIIDAQQGEIEQMQSWRETWFPDAPTP